MPGGVSANAIYGSAGSGGSEGLRPCLWMSAGLVSYKLCDRDFDCEHCPLDAALRGDTLQVLYPPGPSAGAPPGVAAFYFPDDRLYGDGHTWVLGGAGGDVRIGLDAFATALLGTVVRLIPAAGLEGEEASVAAGAPLCTVDLGIGRLPISSPVTGRLIRWNGAVEADATILTTGPYTEGWILEMEVTEAGSPVGLVGAEAALDRSRLDLRRFRRRAAIFLFDDAGAVGPTMADGGEILTDLRCILGAHRYLELVGDLVR